jgi:hypothetical protein
MHVHVSTETVQYARYEQRQYNMHAIYRDRRVFTCVKTDKVQYAHVYIETIQYAGVYTEQQNSTV